MPKRPAPFAPLSGRFVEAPACDSGPDMVRLSLGEVSVLLPKSVAKDLTDCGVALSWMVAQEYDLDAIHKDNKDVLIQGVVFRSNDTHTFFSAGGIIAVIPAANVPVGASAWLYISKSTDTRARTRSSAARR